MIDAQTVANAIERLINAKLAEYDRGLVGGDRERATMSVSEAKGDLVAALHNMREDEDG